MRTLVIIPTYNEAENIPRLFSALFALPLDLQVLVVDDSSPDGTAEVAERFPAPPGALHVLRRTQKNGLRAAYMAGFRWAFANGNVQAIVQMDADLSHNPAALPRMLTRLQSESADLVIGSRYVAGGGVDATWPFWRKALSRFGNTYARAILGHPLHDTTTGYRLWRREALQGLPLERVRSNGYVFLVEMAYLAWKLGYRIAEEPIYFPDRKWGHSKMSFRIQAEAALRIWQIRRQYRDLATPARR